MRIFVRKEGGRLKRTLNVREALLVLYRELYRHVREEENRTIELDSNILKKDQITSSLEVTERGKFVADAVLLHDLNEALKDLTYDTDTALDEVNDLLYSERMGYVLQENDDLDFLPFFKQREGLRQYRGHCVYYCSDTIAPRVKNTPVEKGFIVETTRYVDKNGVYYFGKQKLYTLTERYYQVYHRELHSVGTDFRDSWGKWARYVTDDMFLFGTENPIQSEITGEPGMIYFKYPLNYTEGD